METRIERLCGMAGLVMSGHWSDPTNLGHDDTGVARPSHLPAPAARLP